MVYLFEDYCLDLDRRELRRGAELVTVEPQVFDLLQYLVDNRDRMVSKDDLIAGVWDGRIVSDSTLSSRITAARQAIGDSGEGQRLIRTVPRKGFRFVGEVREGAKKLASTPRNLRLPAAVRSLRGHACRRHRSRFPTSPRSRSCPSPTFLAIRNRIILSTALSRTSRRRCRNSAGCS